MDAAKDAKTIKAAAMRLAVDAATPTERDLARVLAVISGAMAGLPKRIRFRESLRWSAVCATALAIADEYADPESGRPEYLAEYPAHMTRRPRR